METKLPGTMPQTIEEEARCYKYSHPEYKKKLLLLLLLLLLLQEVNLENTGNSLIAIKWKLHIELVSSLLLSSESESHASVSDRKNLSIIP